MEGSDLILRSERVVTATGVRPAVVVVRGGTIAAVLDPAEAPRGGLDAGEVAVLPGLVDLHVHVDEPGRTAWEGFDTATRAAAAGGVTTLLDMPLNSIPPTTSVRALEVKRAAAAPVAHVDVGFWGGAVPGNAGELHGLHQAGVFGFKSFLCDSGVEEFGWLREDELDDVLDATGGLGALLAVHAEDADVLAEAAAAVEASGADPRRYRTWLDCRPADAEETAVRALLSRARRKGARVHVLHVSAAAAARAVGEARATGVAVSAETCPHYLACAAEDVPDGACAYKCAPPIRERANAEALWGLLAGGVLQAVASDHSPCPVEDKRLGEGDFLAAWGGISSLQVALAVTWDAASRRGHGLDDLARWTSSGPAGIAGLPRKGAITPGADADLVLFHPEATWTVRASDLQHRQPVTAYEGRQVTGAVRATYLRGRCVWRDGELAAAATGRLLAREAT